MKTKLNFKIEKESITPNGHKYDGQELVDKMRQKVNEGRLFLDSLADGTNPDIQIKSITGRIVDFNLQSNGEVVFDIEPINSHLIPKEISIAGQGDLNEETNEVENFNLIKMIPVLDAGFYEYTN